MFIVDHVSAETATTETNVGQAIYSTVLECRVEARLGNDGRHPISLGHNVSRTGTGRMNVVGVVGFKLIWINMSWYCDQGLDSKTNYHGA
jgi:hypothetical protein